MFRRDVHRASLAIRLAVAAAVAAPAAAPAQTPAPDPVAVRAALIPRVNDGSLAGIVTAWGDRDSVRFAAAGVARAGGTAIDRETIFELGELGNLLTAALLANLVTNGELSLDDPIEKFLPALAPLSVRAGRAITLGDLAFHRSGLPDRERAGAPVTAAALNLRTVAQVRLRETSGSTYASSQLGLALLERALERHLRAPASEAIQARILEPLGITGLTTGADRSTVMRRATGHTTSGAAVPAPVVLPQRWRGSASDIAQLLAAATDTARGPLAGTFALMMRARSAGPEPDLPVALGWRVLRVDGRDVYWYDAQDVAGFSAYVAIDPRRTRSTLALSNTDVPLGTVAGQLLLGRIPVVAAIPRAPSPARPR